MATNFNNLLGQLFETTFWDNVLRQLFEEIIFWKIFHISSAFQFFSFYSAD